VVDAEALPTACATIRLQRIRNVSGDRRGLQKSVINWLPVSLLGIDASELARSYEASS